MRRVAFRECRKRREIGMSLAKIARTAKVRNSELDNLKSGNSAFFSSLAILAILARDISG
jgi:hypothetical protein